VVPSGKLRGKGRCGVFAGITVWSIPKRFRGEVLTMTCYTNQRSPHNRVGVLQWCIHSNSRLSMQTCRLTVLSTDERLRGTEVEFSITFVSRPVYTTIPVTTQYYTLYNYGLISTAMVKSVSHEAKKYNNDEPEVKSVKSKVLFKSCLPSISLSPVSTHYPSWWVTGFHYPSTRAVLTGNGNRSPVNSGRQLG